MMKKSRAIELLGGTPKKAAKAMGYIAVQSIYCWPETLPQSMVDRVVGVVVRLAMVPPVAAEGIADLLAQADRAIDHERRAVALVTPSRRRSRVDLTLAVSREGAVDAPVL